MSALSNPISTSAADKEKLVSLLHESRLRFLSSFAGVGDEQSRRHPGQGQWSVLDTVEHLTVAERAMVKMVTAGRRPRVATTLTREETFLDGLADRNKKLQSPDPGLPKGRFANLDEASALFETARQNAIRFVQESNEDLRATEVTHPHPALGAVTTYDMLVIMARHAERHALQIEEIKSVLSL